VPLAALARSEEQEVRAPVAVVVDPVLGEARHAVLQPGLRRDVLERVAEVAQEAHGPVRAHREQVRPLVAVDVPPGSAPDASEAGEPVGLGDLREAAVAQVPEQHRTSRAVEREEVVEPVRVHVGQASPARANSAQANSEVTVGTAS